MKKHIYIAFLFCIVSLTGCDNFPDGGKPGLFDG